MGKALVIVESPAKARTISGMLGPDFIVESSVGHIRDLPRGADEVPSAYKGEAWARLGVDVDNGFKPLYVVSAPKKSVVANLKKLLKGADELPFESRLRPKPVDQQLTGRHRHAPPLLPGTARYGIVGLRGRDVTRMGGCR